MQSMQKRMEILFPKKRVDEFDIGALGYALDEIAWDRAEGRSVSRVDMSRRHSSFSQAVVERELVAMGYQITHVEGKVIHVNLGAPREAFESFLGPKPAMAG
ncbi:hypothetical protein SH501x_001433 [Pirellulaceae bacterium SH501]